MKRNRRSRAGDSSEDKTPAKDEPLDSEFLRLLEETLSEWYSREDDEAYRNL